ncbi:MAG: hypothetical protein GDA47_00595, partial [Rhodospirillales bacterium]|nr:hypothetical protein [Rhodospirillales bacterium]
MQNTVRLFAAASTIALLAGCSSDGDNDSSPTTATTTTTSTSLGTGPATGGDAAFTQFQATAIAAAGLAEEHEPQETAAVQLGRAGDALEEARFVISAGTRAEIPGGNGSTSLEVPDYTEMGTTFGFPVGGETLELEVSKEDLFGRSDDLESRAVLTKNGITLLRRSPGADSGDRTLTHTLYGAWMEHAGFAVAVDGDFVVPRDGDSALPIPGRIAAASGDLAETRPAANATWEGLMVGTIREGDDRDDILQGDAELTFDLTRSTLDASFGQIRNLDEGGRLHSIDEVRFAAVPVYQDGYYEYTYTEDGVIRGAFYGDGHAETAGAFTRRGVSGAFGAKREMGGGGNDGSTGPGTGDDAAFTQFQATAIAAAGTGASEPEERAVDQLRRAREYRGRPLTGGRSNGITAEYPGGDGSTAVVYRDNCADNQMNCGRLLRFDAAGDFDLDGEQRGDKDLTLAVEAEDFFHPRSDLDSRA